MRRKATSRPIIHIAAPANPAATVVEALRVRNARHMLEHMQETIGEEYLVTGSLALLEADVDDQRGGRRDDAARVRDLHAALSNDDVAAIVAVRGGGWMVRLLPHIDPHVLDRRRRPVALIGFSEITPLVNLLGRHRLGHGYYYMTPGFPNTGLYGYALRHTKRLAGRKLSRKAADVFADRYARRLFPQEWRRYWRDIKAILSGRPPRRKLIAKHVAGRLPSRKTAVFAGGCLSLVTSMAVEGYRPRIDPRGQWLVLEDLAETEQRIDRQLAHLKVAGWFERCAGVLIGDFHMDEQDQTAAVLELLHYHLPAQRRLPVLVSGEVGHGWPQAVLPLGKPVGLRVSPPGRGPRRVHIEPPWEKLKVVAP